MTNLADHRAVLKRVAVVLVGYSLFEVGVFAYCVARRINFASSVGALGLLSAFFLWRGSLRAAAAWRRGALFFAALLLPGLLLWPAVFPVDLLVAVCRHRTSQALVVGGYLVVLPAMLVWTARELGLESVAAARREAGRKPIDRRYPLGLGGALALGTWILMITLFNGGAAREAERRAAERFGAEYRYRTIGLHGFGSGDDSAVFATVAMWNDKELKVLGGAWASR